MSAYLFINTLKTLACKFRNDKTITGITSDNKEIKISLLGDIAMILADLSSVRTVWHDVVKGVMLKFIVL